MEYKKICPLFSMIVKGRPKGVQNIGIKTDGGGTLGGRTFRMTNLPFELSQFGIGQGRVVRIS